MTRPLPAKIGAIDAGMGRHDSEEDWNETREDSITPKGKPVSRVQDKVAATPVWWKLLPNKYYKANCSNELVFVAFTTSSTSHYFQAIQEKR